MADEAIRCEMCRSYVVTDLQIHTDKVLSQLARASYQQGLAEGQRQGIALMKLEATKANAKPEEEKPHWLKHAESQYGEAFIRELLQGT